MSVSTMLSVLSLQSNAQQTVIADPFGSGITDSCRKDGGLYVYHFTANEW
jgi:hypothetical protein